MLEPTEDKSNEGPSSTVGERSPPVNKTVTTDRLVYKLVKVGDDGSVLPATEDEVFQSLVEGSSAGLPPSYAGGSDVNEDDEDDSDGKEDPSFPSEMDDLVAEKKKLLSRLQVKVSRFQHPWMVKARRTKKHQDSRVCTLHVFSCEPQ